MTNRPSPARRRTTQLLAAAVAMTFAATVAGCASSAGKSGPTSKALVGTWSCEVDGDRGTKYNDDGYDDPISFFGGDKFTVTITSKRFTVEGQRDGSPVKVGGTWNQDYRTTKTVLGFDFWADDGPRNTPLSLALPAKLTKDEVRLTKDNVGLPLTFDSNRAELVASASKLTWNVSGKDPYSSGPPYAIKCSR